MSRISPRPGRDRLRPSDGSTYGNYRLANREIRAAKTEIRARPSHLRIEITSHCNLRCVQCPIGTYEFTNQHLSDHVLEALEREVLPTVAFVQYADLGEPLLYPRLDHALQIGRTHGIPSMRLFTNGIRLDEDVARKLVDSGITELAVSVDGATQETFGAIRPSAKLDQIVANLARLRDVRDASGSDRPRIVFSVMGLRSVVEELDPLLRLARELDASRIELRRLSNPTKKVAEQRLDRGDHDVLRRIESAADHGRAIGVPLKSNITLSAPPADAAEPIDDRFYRGRVTVVHAPETLCRESVERIVVAVTNESPMTWHSSRWPTTTSAVNLAYRIYDEHGAVLVPEGQRASIPETLGPGETREVEIPVYIPDHPGTVIVEFDLVNEGHRWFGIDARRRFTVTEDMKIENSPDHGTECTYPWRYASIKVNGDVCPCRFLSRKMGNLERQSFAEIWNADAYRALRASILDRSYSMCQGACCPFVRATPLHYVCGFELLEAPASAEPNAMVSMRVRLTNRGTLAWKNPVGEKARFTASYHLLRANHTGKPSEGSRTKLPTSVQPGESVDVTLHVRTPKHAGDFVAVVDVVQEDVNWFESLGNDALDVPITVRPPSRSSDQVPMTSGR